jgi:hypothetical protein
MADAFATASSRTVREAPGIVKDEYPDLGIISRYSEIIVAIRAPIQTTFSFQLTARSLSFAPSVELAEL